MSKSKVYMPREIEMKCHAAIHSASAAAGGAGLIPIPLADTVPISAIQVTMVVALGKIFDLVISESVAKACIGVCLAKSVGRTIFSSLTKLIPGIGQIVGSTTAIAVTETMGWLIADDFYRISNGQKPQDIIGAGRDIEQLVKTRG